MSALKEHYGEAIEAAISKAKACRDLVTVEAFFCAIFRQQNRRLGLILCRKGGQSLVKPAEPIVHVFTLARCLTERNSSQTSARS